MLESMDIMKTKSSLLLDNEYLTVDHEQGIVTKVYDYQDIMIEKRNTIFALEMEKEGLFYIPGVLNKDTTRNIEFEFIPDLVPVKQATKNKSKQFFRIGQILRLIHNKYAMPTAYKKESSWVAQFSKELIFPKSFLHGDFTVNNVQLQKGTNKLYIIDWASSYLAGTSFNYGVCVWDICLFINSLFYYPPYMLLDKRKLSVLADSFLAGYMGKKTTFSTKDLAQYCLNFSHYDNQHNHVNYSWKRKLIGIRLFHMLKQYWTSKL